MWGQDILPGSIHELGILSTGPGCLRSVGEARQCIMSQSSWTRSAQEMSPQGPAAKSQSCSAVGRGRESAGQEGLATHQPWGAAGCGVVGGSTSFINAQGTGAC